MFSQRKNPYCDLLQILEQSYNFYLTYKYYRLDGTGNVIDTGTPFRTGKAIFINMADLNPSLDLMIEVNDTKWW